MQILFVLNHIFQRYQYPARVRCFQSYNSVVLSLLYTPPKGFWASLEDVARGLCRLHRLYVQAEAMLKQGVSCKSSFVTHGNVARFPDKYAPYYPNLARLQA